MGRGATQAPANSDANPDEAKNYPAPVAQDSEMSNVHGTMGDESPIYSSDEATEGKTEDANLVEGDQGEQFWDSE